MPSSPTSPRKPEDYSQVLAAEEPCDNHLHAFMARPQNMRYEAQQDEEQILLFLRRHPITNLPWVLLAIFMVIAPFLLLPFFPPFAMLPVNFKFVLMVVWYLFTSGFVIEKLLVWFFESFIITDERMIDVDFYSLVYKRVNYAQLEKIEDVDTQTGGVLFSLMDVGSVLVQTAAEIPQFEISGIPHPSKVAKLLNELVQEEQQEKIEGRVR